MQAGSNVQLQRVPEKLSRLDNLPAEGAESGSDDDDDDKGETGQPKQMVVHRTFGGLGM